MLLVSLDRVDRASQRSCGTTATANAPAGKFDQEVQRIVKITIANTATENLTSSLRTRLRSLNST